MPTRSKVAMLPAAVRAELDRLIVEHAFSGYQALAERLQAQGYQIADDSVQRYGARMRCELEALELARHQALALAAAGHSAGDTADALTAITVQLLQQQVLSTLLQSAHVGSSERTETDDARSTNAADREEKGRSADESPALTGAEPGILDVRDLVRLTRVTVDLNRITKARHQRAEQFGSAPRRDDRAESRATTLSDESYQAIRKALRDEHPLDSRSFGAPPPERDGTSAASTQSGSDITAPAETQQNVSEASQPHLTADSRSYPHQKLTHLPADACHHLSPILICPGDRDLAARHRAGWGRLMHHRNSDL